MFGLWALAWLKWQLGNSRTELGAARLSSWSRLVLYFSPSFLKIFQKFGLVSLIDLIPLQVVQDAPPRLPPGVFSAGFEDLIAKCLQKKCEDRPNYEELLANEFIKEHTQKETNVSEYVNEILDLENSN